MKSIPLSDWISINICLGNFIDLEEEITAVESQYYLIYCIPSGWSV